MEKRANNTSVATHLNRPAAPSQVRGLKFKVDIKRVDRTNARVAYINDDMTEPERALWEAQFDGKPEMLTAEERAAWYVFLHAATSQQVL